MPYSSSGSDKEDVEDTSSGSDSEDFIIPRKVPVSLCADCKRLFDRQNWSWELHEPCDESQEPYYQVPPESLPRPRLRPIDFYEADPCDFNDDCRLCEILGLEVQLNIRSGFDFPYEQTEPLDITEVSHFKFGVRLYENGFIELWLGYESYDPGKSWDMVYLLTLVPITEDGWCGRSPSPTSSNSSLLEPPATDSERSFQLMRGWLEDCRSHSTCRLKVPGTVKRLPARLIQVTSLPGESEEIEIKAKLCQGSDLPEDTPYATLSHCWGKTKFLTLTKGNLDQMVRDIPIAQLSQVFRDAMIVTLNLGLSYLWIDSLCILQDCEDSEDWKREAPRMGDVYSQATLGIAATGFDDGRQGLFPRHRTFSQNHSMACVPVDWELGKVLPCLSIIHSGLFAFTDLTSLGGIFPYKEPNAAIDKGPLYRRGWTLQERVLSPRVIHFCAKEIRWECEQLVASESFPASFNQAGLSTEERRLIGRGTGAFWSIRRLPSLSNNEAQHFWRYFAEFYSTGKFTVTDDRVAAIVGIAQILERISGDRYIFGCWLNVIHRNLLWSRPEIFPNYKDHFYYGPAMSIPKQRRAPSWSWLSVDGGISFNWVDNDAMAFPEVKISDAYREGRSEPSTEYDCARPIASSASSLVVEGPLYSVRHKVWEGAELSLDEQEEYDGACVNFSWEFRFRVQIDARGAQKPTGPGIHRQHLLRWASPTHLLPLLWCARGPSVQGLLLVEDPEKDDVFTRVGCFDRRFTSSFESPEPPEEKARAVFGCDGFDRDPDSLARAGLYFLGTRRFLLE